MNVFKDVFSLAYTKEENRIDIYDFLRGFAMMIVLLHHASMPMSGYFLIFHMPLFFFLSGMVSGGRKTQSFRLFFISRFKRLMIPYFFWGGLLLLFWFIRGILVGESFDIYKGIIGLLIGKYGYVPETQSGIYWFLYVIFVSNLLLYPINRYFNGSLFFQLSTIALLIFLSYCTTHWLDLSYFAIDKSFMGAAFILIGSLFNPNIRYLSDQKIRISEIVLIVLGLTCVVLSQKMNSQVIRMYLNQYGEYEWFFIGALAGIVSFLIIGKYLYLLFRKKRSLILSIFMWAGYNSLVLFIIHLIINQSLIYFYDTLGITEIVIPLILWLLKFVVMFVISIVVCNLIIIYMPWSMGMNINRKK